MIAILYLTMLRISAALMKYGSAICVLSLNLSSKINIGSKAINSMNFMTPDSQSYKIIIDRIEYIKFL